MIFVVITKEIILKQVVGVACCSLEPILQTFFCCNRTDYPEILRYDLTLIYLVKNTSDKSENIKHRGKDHWTIQLVNSLTGLDLTKQEVETSRTVILPSP